KILVEIARGHRLAAMRKRGRRIDNGLTQIVRTAQDADGRQFRSGRPAFTVNNMTRRATAALIDGNSLLRIASAARRSGAAQRTAVCDQLPLFVIRSSAHSRHATIHDSIANDRTKRLVVLSPR